MPSFVRAGPQGAQAVRTAVPELSDEDLLVGFAASDPQAAAAFVGRFRGRVFGLAFTILGESRAAEDAAQEALLRVWRNAAVFDSRRGTVSSWLLTITRNVAVDALRARRAVPIDPDDLLRAAFAAPEREPGDVAALHDDLRRMRDALSLLPDEQRRAVVLARIWGLSAQKVADHEGIPLGTAKTRIRTALLRLRAALAHELDRESCG